MKKVKHSLKIISYSDEQLGLMCCYTKKYTIGYNIRTDHILVGECVSFDDKSEKFKALRKLVKMKHDTINKFNTAHVCLIQSAAPHIEIGEFH